MEQHIGTIQWEKKEQRKKKNHHLAHDSDLAQWPLILIYFVLPTSKTDPTMANKRITPGNNQPAQAEAKKLKCKYCCCC